MQIDASFPGGNIIVDRIEGDVVHLHQDLRDTEGHWFYWYFRVRGAAGRTIRFDFHDPKAIGVHGPAVSRDGGRSWQWAGAAAVTETAFVHRFANDDDDVRFSVGIPYVLSDLEQYLQHRPGLMVSTLCRTRGGRVVPMLTCGSTDGNAPGVLVTARQHCCEAMASFVLEGLLDAVLDDPWYRQSVRVVAIPMVDLDGVQAGDQGKNRRPHDHNRDYVSDPLYPESAAIMDLVRHGLPAPPQVMLDLHCPWLRGTRNQAIYLVGSRNPLVWSRQQQFGQVLEKVGLGELPYRAADNLPFGQDWNTERNEGLGCNCARWMTDHGRVALASTLEFPYADVRGQIVTPSRARRAGRQLAAAVAAAMQQHIEPAAADLARSRRIK